MTAEQPKSLADMLRMLHQQRLPREVLDDLADSHHESEH